MALAQLLESSHDTQAGLELSIRRPQRWWPHGRLGTMHLMTRDSVAKRNTTVAWTLVGIQALLLIGIVAAPRDETWRAGTALRAVGLLLVLLGVALGLWAAAKLGRGLTPSPLPNGAIGLVTAGPYSWVRHPMYTAVMLAAAGIALRAGSLAVVAQTLALLGLFHFKARWEEARLGATFPGYSSYQEVTPRFVPRWGRPRGSIVQE
jgi:protein-S-isoprenylcysteine O-methyltransferase Ste14